MESPTHIVNIEHIYDYINYSILLLYSNRTCTNFQPYISDEFYIKDSSQTSFERIISDFCDYIFHCVKVLPTKIKLFSSFEGSSLPCVKVLAIALIHTHKML